MPYGSSRRAASILSLAALAVSILCFAALGAMVSFCGICYVRAVDPSPSPGLDEISDVDGFPQVDWQQWRTTNPDVVGWITIPGTPVDYPIVQAPADDPTYYLDHDVYGQWNYAGCPYLDAECSSEGLLDCRNAVVFAHNLGLGDTSQFATVAQYTDHAFAQDHAVVLVQTPEEKRFYHIRGAACIMGDQTTKRTSFASREDFLKWYRQRMAECSVTFPESPGEPSQILTLCTCSYNRWDNERTLLYAAP